MCVCVCVVIKTEVYVYHIKRDCVDAMFTDYENSVCLDGNISREALYTVSFIIIKKDLTILTLYLCETNPVR